MAAGGGRPVTTILSMQKGYLQRQLSVKWGHQAAAYRVYGWFFRRSEEKKIEPPRVWGSLGSHKNFSVVWIDDGWTINLARKLTRRRRVAMLWSENWCFPPTWLRPKYKIVGKFYSNLFLFYHTTKGWYYCSSEFGAFISQRNLQNTETWIGFGLPYFSYCTYIPKM